MSIYSFILLLIAVLNLFLAVFSLRRERNKMTISYFAFMLCVVFYAFGYAFELSAKDLSDIKFWLNIEYIGIPFFTPFFLLFALYFTGKDKIITVSFLVLIFSISIITFFIHQTNFNHLFIVKYDVIKSNGLFLSNFEKGIWYWIHQAYFNIVVLISAVLFAQMMFNSRGINQVRAAIMLFNTLLPWPFYLVYLMGYGPTGIDISAYSLSLVGFIGSIGLMRFDLLNFVPIAFSQVFESMKDAVVILDSEKKIININDAAYNLFSSLSNKKVERDSIIDLNNYPELAAVIAQEKHISSVDVEFSIDGEIKHYIASVSLVVKYADIIRGYILTMIDITERKEIEKLLIQNESKLIQLNNAKDKFYALIAHDLRNPFNSLLNLSSYLKASIENGDKEKSLRLANAFNVSAQNGYALLQNLLDWAKIQQGIIQYNPDVCDLNALVKEETLMALELAKLKNISIKIELVDDIVAYADENMIRAVLRNLLTNAIKYSKGFKEIVITGEIQNKVAKISVYDQGIGIKKEDIPFIFNSSVAQSSLGTNNERGTGFGLKLCKELIALHKGELGVESIEGEGSCFWFQFPAN